MNHDEQVDRALALIANAEPPVGMQARLLARLAAEDLQVAKWSRWWMMPAAAAVAIAAVCILLMPHHHPGVTAPRLGARIDPPLVSAPMPRLPAMRAAVVHHAHSQRVVSIAQERSFPAPPEPLTEQERLLLRIVHRDDPQELAMLNEEAQQKALDAEIQSFEESQNIPDTTNQPGESE